MRFGHIFIPHHDLIGFEKQFSAVKGSGSVLDLRGPSRAEFCSMQECTFKDVCEKKGHIE